MAFVIEKEDLGFLNIAKTLGNNFAATQLKNELLRNPAYADITLGLQSEDPIIHAQAMKELNTLAQEKFGLEVTDLNFYDASKTSSGSLADSKLGNVKGGVVTDESHEQYGNINIDVGDNVSKTGTIATLGHEILEVQYLQKGDGSFFFANSESTQEALGDSFGAQFSDRINQAAGGDLDSTGGSDFNYVFKNSSVVTAGTEMANSVGNATVDHRQLYVSEVAVILKGASAYADKHGISEVEAKKELTQQALLQVDQTWSEQKHIKENPRARDELNNIASEQNSLAQESYTGRNPIDMIFDTEESEFFQAKDQETFEDTNINAREVTLIERGEAGEFNFLAKYATENGKAPIDIGMIDGAGQAVENVVEGAKVVYQRIDDDPLKFAGDVVDGAVDSVKDTLKNPETLVYSGSEGDASDRLRVAELQGNQEAALQEKADQFVETITVPGVGKVVKGVTGEVLDVAVKQAKKVDVDVPRGNTAYHATNGPNISQNILDEINPDFLNPDSRFGKAFYIGDSAETVTKELAHHGADSTHAIRYTINTDSAKILDLTDPKVANEWDYSGGSISDQTKSLGDRALDKGFNVIKFNSERSSGVNHAVLDDFDKVITPETVVPTKQ